MASSVSNPPEVTQPFKSADEHFGALLGWLHRLLAWQINLTRLTFGALADDEYRGLYVPDAEVDILSGAPPEMPPEMLEERQALAEERRVIEAQAKKSERANIDLPLLRIGRLFGLSQLECDALLLVLAPEVDLRYERLYAYLQDDVTKKRPTVDLALRLFCMEPQQRLRARAAFEPNAPLLRHHLIQLFDDGQRQPPLLARSIKLDDRVVTEVLGHPTVDAMIADCVSLSRPNRSIEDLVLPVEFLAQLRQAVKGHLNGLVLAIQGTYGTGRRAIAETLCTEIGVPLLSVDIDRLMASDLMPAEAMRRVLREAALGGTAILWLGADRLLHEEGMETWRLAFLSSLDEHYGCSFLPVDQPWEARGALRRSTFFRVEIPDSSYTEREQLWRQRLNGDAPEASSLAALASTFRLSGGQIRDAVAMARSLARWRNGTISPEDFYVACRAQSSGKLDNLAHKIKTTYRWEDIVLPADQTKMLREICAQVRHRRTVLETWGFDRRLAMGKGVNVLFAGPSGTGKTMSAEIIAATLGLELYKVDLSTMVSKYIGETEKNLNRIFTAAREANAILFFDEADAIFGKRSEVKDAHDRYANVEVGYLLQKMEEYDGIVILATNLRKNLDDAFIRRLHVAIDFPFPEEPDRLHIWQKVFPVEAPIGPDVDLAFMARQFKLAGGNIRNIALLSAFMAAEAGNEIGMVHVVHATKREYQKLGKLITESDFGPYLALMKRNV